MRRYTPTRQEVKAALNFYAPILPMFKQNQGCWSLIPKRGLAQEHICGSLETSWYILDSKTSNIGKGPTVPVRLCIKHAEHAARYYRVTKVNAP